jgi:hypothetical protein
MLCGSLRRTYASTTHSTCVHALGLSTQVAFFSRPKGVLSCIIFVSQRRGERQEARAKRQEARTKRQEARGKRREARGKRREARGKRQEAYVLHGRAEVARRHVHRLSYGRHHETA